MPLIQCVCVRSSNLGGNRSGNKTDAGGEIPERGLDKIGHRH